MRLTLRLALQDRRDPSSLPSAQRESFLEIYLFQPNLNFFSSVYTVVLSNRLLDTIPKEVPPALIQAGLPSTSVADFLTTISAGTVAAFAVVPGLIPAIQATGIKAYEKATSDAYNTVYLCTIAFSGIGIILSFSHRMWPTC